MEILQAFKFDAAHRLPNAPPGHKCKRVHGHTFNVEINVSGRVEQHSGWVIDFDDIKEAFDPILEQIDHSYLNDIEGLDNPTSENIAKWIWVRLKPKLPGLTKIVVGENSESGAIYRGEED